MCAWTRAERIRCSRLVRLLFRHLFAHALVVGLVEVGEVGVKVEQGELVGGRQGDQLAATLGRLVANLGDFQRGARRLQQRGDV